MTLGAILHIADYSSAFASNFVTSLFWLQRATHDQLGLDTVYAFPDAARGKPWLAAIEGTGVPVWFIPRDVSHGQRVRVLRRLIVESSAALVHTHFGTFDVDASYAARRVRVPVVWHMHSPFSASGPLRRAVGERIKFAVGARVLVDRIVAVAPSVRDGAVAAGAPRSKFRIVLNGIDTDRAHPLDPGRRRDLRHAYGILDDDTVFLLLGWAPIRKGVPTFAAAARLLAASSSSRLRCLIVSGDQNALDIQAMVRDSPACQVIHSVPDVAELYGIADCFVSASRAEGLPYALGEAMAARLPVITSDLPQVVQAYGGAGAGVIAFRAGQDGALASAMHQVLEANVGERDRWGGANSAFIRANFSVAGWVQEMVSVYREVLGTSTRSEEHAEGFEPPRGPAEQRTF